MRRKFPADQTRTSREIGEELGIKLKTVETHRMNIKNKLGSNRLADLVEFASGRN